MRTDQLEKMKLWLDHYEANGSDSVLPDPEIIREMVRICTLVQKFRGSLAELGITGKDL